MFTNHPTRRELLHAAATCGLVAALGDAAAAFAGSSDPDARSATDADAEIQSLATVLPYASWDPADRGPLLAVDPARTLRITDGADPLPLPGPDAAGRINLVRTLPAFGRAIFPVGSLAVIAPTEMTVLPDGAPRSAIRWEGLSRSERILFLLATMTTSQWQKLGSAAGIGAADLSDDDQRAAFLSLLPDPFIVRSGTVNGGGSLDNDGEPRRLSDVERAGIRLRIHVTLMLLVAESEIPGAHGRTSDEPYLGMPGDTIVKRDFRSDRIIDGGALIIASHVPNRPKPADIDYDDPRLATFVALAGAKTVADAIARVAGVTGIELVPDFRVAALPIYVRGASARTGDLLQALALAVCGSWRRVGDGDTYVLTASLTGAGARRLRLAEWYASLDTLKRQQLADWHAALVDRGFAKYVTPQADDPLSPDPALNDRIANNFYASVPTVDLPPAMREWVRQFLSRRDPKLWNATSVIPERLAAAQFVLPDGTPLVGDIGMTVGNMMDFDPGSRLLPPDAQNSAIQPAATPVIPNNAATTGPPLPLPSTGMAIALAATTADDAHALPALVRRHGFGELWVRTDDPSVATAAVVGATADARAAGITTPLPIWALASVFAAPADAPASDIDRNILGKTGPEAMRGEAVARSDGTLARVGTLEPATIPVIGAAAESRFAQLRGVAFVPGLAGLALDTPAPYGYADRRTPVDYAGRDLDPVHCARAEMGYAAAVRLDFLRKAGVDPIDLIPEGLQFPADTRTPFSLDAGAHGQQAGYDPRDMPVAGFAEKTAEWEAFRGPACHRTLAHFRATVRATRPGLPVFIAPQSSVLKYGVVPEFHPATLFVAWDNPDVQPLGADFGSVEISDRAAFAGRHTVSAFVVLNAIADATGPGSAAAAMFDLMQSTRTAGAQQQAQSVVLDLSALTTAEATAILECWVTPAPGARGA